MAAAELIRESLIGLGYFAGYYAAMLVILVPVRFAFNLTGELFRKMLHVVCFTSVFVLLYAVDTWYVAVIVTQAFSALIYQLVRLAERFPAVMSILEERRAGEIRSSLIAACLMMAILIVIFWGLLGPEWRYVIVVAILAWGLGDAAAAMVGKNYGRRRIKHRWTEGTKTLEGTSAMAGAAGLSTFIALWSLASLPWYLCLILAAIIAPVAALVELVSRRGSDTFTVPLATAAATFALILLAGLPGGVG